MDKLYKDISDNKWFYIIILIMPFIVYFVEFSSFPMTLDELRRHGTQAVDIGWINQGRWGMYFLTKVYASNPVMPYLGIYISTVMVCVFLRNFLKYFFPTSKNVDLLTFCCVFVSYPSLYYLYSFSTISFIIGFIYLFSTISVVKTLEQGLVNKLLAILLLVLSLSLYQSAITVFFCLSCIALFGLSVDNKLNKRNFLEIITVLISSLFVYYLSITFFHYYFKVKSSGYLGGFYEVKYSVAYILSLFESFFYHTIRLYYYPKSMFLSNNFPLDVLLICSFFIVFFKKNKFSLIIFIILIVISPVLLNLMSLNGLPTRTLIALPLSVAFLVYCLLIFTKNCRVKYCILVLAVLSVFYNLVSVTKLSFIDSNSWKNDQKVALLMVDRIYNLRDLPNLTVFNNGHIPVHLIGYKNGKGNEFLSQKENIGKGFFSWGDNELLNINNLLQSIGFTEFRFAKLTRVRKHLDQIRMMDNWPSSNSIKSIDNVVYIKVSDYTEAQYRLLCDKKYYENISIPLACSVSYNPLSIPFLFLNSKSKLASTLYSSIKDHDEKILNGNFKSQGEESTLLPDSNDVQIILPKIVSNKSYLVLSISGFYKQDDMIELYVYDESIKNYKYNGVIRINVKKGFNKLMIKLPTYIFENNLRVDATSKKIEIGQFNIKVSEPSSN